MAFFNLTQLGPQDSFKKAMKSQNHFAAPNSQASGGSVSMESLSSCTHEGNSSTRRKKEPTMTITREQAVTTGDGSGAAATEVTPSTRKNLILTVWNPYTNIGLLTGHTAMYSSCKMTTQHGGSYTKYIEQLHKHQRNTKGPMDLYHQPLTTSQMYGWWMSHGQPHKASWAQGPRHVHVNSEMTRCIHNTVKPLNKRHFGDNINSAVLSLSRRFLMYGNYNILGLEAVSLVERSNIQCPFLGVSFIRGSTVIQSTT